MKHLVEGVRRFRNEQASQYRDLFAKLAREGQQPSTMFITCADSRIAPQLLTQSGPGDLFVVRNIGNIVPSSAATESHSVAAAIEFAVLALGVRHIVVCGHTHCGAMEALLRGVPNASAMPHLQAWLNLAAPVRDRLGGGNPQQITAAVEENVRLALQNLATYPCVAEQTAAGNLQIHGWMFDIASTEVSVLDARSSRFHPLLP